MRCRTWFHSSKPSIQSHRRQRRSYRAELAAIRIEGQHRRVLRMNHCQVRRELFEDADRRRLIVDEDTALPLAAISRRKMI